MSESVIPDENYFDGWTDGEIARFFREQSNSDENEQLAMLDDYLEGK